MTKQELKKKINEEIEIYKQGKTNLCATEITSFLSEIFKSVYAAGCAAGCKAGSKKERDYWINNKHMRVKTRLEELKEDVEG